MFELKNGDTILFQGDSVTDAGRIKDKPEDMGLGYPMLIKSLSAVLEPEKEFTWYNRGISGNRTKDLLSRWQQDCIDLKPDLVSILIGINNTWRRYDRNDPTPVDVFEDEYRQILTMTKDNTNAKLLLIEPFVLPHPPDRQEWREDLDPKIQVVRKLALEFGAALLPMDGIFAQYASLRYPSYWAADGVHPTREGHMLIAKHWTKLVFGV